MTGVLRDEIEIQPEKKKFARMLFGWSGSRSGCALRGKTLSVDSCRTIKEALLISPCTLKLVRDWPKGYLPVRAQ